MKIRETNAAFTLVEMLTVMAVIAVLASLVVSVNAFAHKKAALVRAEGEIKTMIAASEAYKADFGSYPQGDTGDASAQSPTVLVCPVINGNPTDKIYQKACQVLYKALSGDVLANGKATEKSYCEFRPDQLRKSPSGEILHIQDPFGNSYGYSTTAAVAEETFRQRLEKSPLAKRLSPYQVGGFNTTYDLWSTGGVISNDSGKELDDERKRWVKNW